MWPPSSSGNDAADACSADTRKRTTPKSLPSGRPSQYGLTSPNPQQLEDLVNCAVEREMTKRLNGTPQMHSQRLPPHEVQQPCEPSRGKFCCQSSYCVRVRAR